MCATACAGWQRRLPAGNSRAWSPRRSASGSSVSGATAPWRSGDGRMHSTSAPRFKKASASAARPRPSSLRSRFFDAYPLIRLRRLTEAAELLVECQQVFEDNKRLRQPLPRVHRARRPRGGARSCGRRRAIRAQRAAHDLHEDDSRPDSGRASASRPLPARRRRPGGRAAGALACRRPIAPAQRRGPRHWTGSCSSCPAAFASAAGRGTSPVPPDRLPAPWPT